GRSSARPRVRRRSTPRCGRPRPPVAVLFADPPVSCSRYLQFARSGACRRLFTTHPQAVQIGTESDQSGTALSQPPPGGRDAFLHVRPTHALPLCDAPGGEGGRRSYVVNRGGPEALLGDHGVLMIAQEFLQDARSGEEPLARIASRRRELGGIAGALERDPEPVDLLLVGSLAQSLDEPRDTPELLLRERFEGNLLHTLGKARRKTKTRQY